MNTNKFRYALPIIIWFSSSAVYAEIYKCKDTDGNVTFSGKPCANNAKRVELEVLTPAFSATHIIIGGKYYTAMFTHNKINRVTKWRKGDGKPPIDESNAFKLASTMLAKQFPYTRWKERQIKLNYTAENKGFYSVTLTNVNNESDGAIVFVLMTGEVSKVKPANIE